jgi:hypothetical protein
VALLPQPAAVIAHAKKGSLKLGYAVVTQNHALTPSKNSSSEKAQFSVHLSNSALTEFESLRDGRNFELELALDALAVISNSEEPVSLTRDTYPFPISHEDWANVLQQVGYCETLVTELRIPTSGPDSTASGRKRLGAAVAARNNGSYAEAMRICRISLDELKQAGFAGKAPQDIAEFLQQNAGTMSQAERFAALQVALKLFLSPASHANAPDEEYSREDAELAIAMVAAMLRLAPQHGTEANFAYEPNK